MFLKIKLGLYPVYHFVYSSFSHISLFGDDIVALSYVDEAYVIY